MSVRKLIEVKFFNEGGYMRAIYSAASTAHTLSVGDTISQASDTRSSYEPASTLAFCLPSFSRSRHR